MKILVCDPVSPKGIAFLNAPAFDSHPSLDATGLAAKSGSPLMANLVLLGFALRHGKLFCSYKQVEEVTGKISPERFRAANLQALKLGYSSGKAGDKG